MVVEFTHSVDAQTAQRDSSPSPDLRQPPAEWDILKKRKPILEYSGSHVDGLLVLLLPGLPVFHCKLLTVSFRGIPTV